MQDRENSINAIGNWLRRLRKNTALLGPEDILYQQVYSGPYKDVSIYDDKGVIIAGEKDGIISGFGRPMVALGGESFLKDKVSELLQNSKGIIYLDWLEGGEVGAISKLLLQRGAIARPYFGHVIDLTKSEEELHAGVRKSYTSLINKYFNKLAISPPHHISNLQDLHHQVNGRQTRSNQTWKLQEEMVENNKAFLVTIFEGHKLLAGALFYHNNYSCYYACAVSTIDSHAIIWKGILHAKQLGLLTMDFGEHIFSPVGTDVGGYICDEKLVNICKFKTGFGGVYKVGLFVDLKRGA